MVSNATKGSKASDRGNWDLNSLTCALLTGVLLTHQEA